MIIRDAVVEDFPALKALLSAEGLDSQFLFHALQESDESLIVDAGGIQGFVLVRKLGDFSEITHWSLKPGFDLLLKSLKKTVQGPLAVHEREGNAGRINLLKSAGFREVKTLEGVYHGEKAVMLVKD